MPNLPLKLPARYRVKDTFFSGGQGDVYLCHDAFLDRRVVVKFIRVGNTIEAIMKEAQALSKVRSKHVVELFEIVSDKEAEVIGLILEYVPGEDLNRFTTRNLDELLKALFQIASGIADIHSAGIIHRDIKPKNMKSDKNGVIKIFDFGLACNVDESITTAARGTREYKGPEYYAGPPINLTKAADVYAFGVTAWRLIDNTLPWELRYSPPKIPPSFAQHQIGLPSDIVETLDRTLDHDPSRRPDMDQVRDKISAHLLAGRHEGRVFYQGKATKLNANQKRVGISMGSIGSANIEYTGLGFVLRNVLGDVYVNGARAASNYVLPSSCVITLGAPVMGSQREFVAFDISHPEVVF